MEISRTEWEMLVNIEELLLRHDYKITAELYGDFLNSLENECNNCKGKKFKKMKEACEAM